MNVFVAGANGQIGRHLVKLFHESEDYSVKAMVRHQEQTGYFTEQGVNAVVGDLEDSVSSLAGLANGCDAVVFAAGSGGKTGPDKTLLIDLDGAVKMAEAAEQIEAKRFILVSAIQANHRENWNEKIRPYFVAKHYADKMVEQSKLNYTIIRPGGLTNEPGTGKIRVAENLSRDSISREDVARTIFYSMQEKNTFFRSFDLVQGKVEIEEALQAF